VELAQWHVASLGVSEASDAGHLASALAAVNKAILRDPERVALYRQRAGLLEACYRHSGSAVDLAAALGAARRVVQMYSDSPDDHVWLADMLARADAALGTGEFAAEAVAHYREALALDATRAQGEVRRWSEARRGEVRDRILALTPPPATEPASSPAEPASTSSG
jgi:hypothetical protein